MTNDSPVEILSEYLQSSNLFYVSGDKIKKDEESI
jgi:hypothetical protein